MLSESDTRAIQAMRQMLSEWEGMAGRQGTQTDHAVATFAYGRFAEACHHAADSLRDVLGVADSYLDDVHAAEALREGR